MKRSIFLLFMCGVVWCALELASFFVLRQWDFYYLLPFPVTKPDIAFIYEDTFRPALQKKDLRLVSWIESDPELIWKSKKNINDRFENVTLRRLPSFEYSIFKMYHYFTVKTNTKGFRTPEFEDRKRNGVIRVVGLGDSNVWGWAVDENYSFMGVLREQLTPFSVEVINLGCPGYTSTQGVALLDKEVISLKPDFLLVWFGANDSPAMVRKTDSELIRYNRTGLGRVNTFLFSYSYIFRLMHKSFFIVLQKKEVKSEKVSRVPQDEFEKNMEHIAAQCASNGIEAIFLSNHQLPDLRQRIVSDIAKRHGFSFVATQELYRLATQEMLSLPDLPRWNMFERYFLFQWVIPLDNHPTIPGHRLIAEKLRSIIVSKLQRGIRARSGDRRRRPLG